MNIECIINEDGSEAWYINDFCGRPEELPCWISATGTELWSQKDGTNRLIGKMAWGGEAGQNGGRIRMNP